MGWESNENRMESYGFDQDQGMLLITEQGGFREGLRIVF
jgi:hypothetical protein